MSKVFASLGMSLDGFIAGPNSRPDNPLGDGGTRIHEWVFGVESWRERQSIDGGQTNLDDDIVQENFSRAGAYIMGRQMFAEGEVGWPDPPPFRAPVFVLTHTPRVPWVRQGGTTFTFVTEGIDSALAQARKAAGNKDVQISGGADTVRQFIGAGLLDELQIHLAPLVLGSGVRLFDGVSPDLGLVPSRVVDSPQVTHLTYQITAFQGPSANGPRSPNALGGSGWDLFSIPPGRLQALARFAKAARAQAVAGLGGNRRLATLVAFASVMPQVAADEAIEVFDPVMGDVIGVRVGTEKETGVAVESSDGP